MLSAAMALLWWAPWPDITRIRSTPKLQGLFPASPLSVLGEQPPEFITDRRRRGGSTLQQPSPSLSQLWPFCYYPAGLRPQEKDADKSRGGRSVYLQEKDAGQPLIRREGGTLGHRGAGEEHWFGQALQRMRTWVRRRLGARLWDRAEKKREGKQDPAEKHSKTSEWFTGKSHRITESQNVQGWKGPLWVIQSNPPDKAGSPTAGCTGPRPGGV